MKKDCGTRKGARTDKSEFIGFFRTRREPIVSLCMYVCTYVCLSGMCIYVCLGVCVCVCVCMKIYHVENHTLEDQEALVCLQFFLEIQQLHWSLDYPSLSSKSAPGRIEFIWSGTGANFSSIGQPQLEKTRPACRKWPFSHSPYIAQYRRKSRFSDENSPIRGNWCTNHRLFS